MTASVIRTIAMAICAESDYYCIILMGHGQAAIIIMVNFPQLLP